MAPLTHLLLGEPETLRSRSRLRALGHAAWRWRATRYLAAFVFVGVAALVKSIDSLGLGGESPTRLLIAAIVASAVLGGVGPGLIATGLSLAAIIAFFAPQGDEIGFTIQGSTFVVTFLVEALVVVAIAGVMRHTVARLRFERGRESVLAALAGQALASCDERELFDVAVERVGQVMQADRTAIFRTGSELSMAASWRWDGAPTSFGGSSEASLSSWLQPGVHVIDASGAPAELRAFFPARKTNLVCASIDLGQSHNAILATFRESPPPFTSADRLFLETVAAILGSAVQRRASELALARSEERLRAAQTAAHAGTWEWDAVTGNLVWSDGFEPLHGVAPGQLPRTFAEYLDLVHLEDRDRVRAAAREAKETGRFDVRYRVQLPDGTTRWIGGRGQVFFGADGRPSRVVGVGADLTDEMRVQDAVRASEERFRMMANAAPVLLRVCGPDGGCLFVNERWSALTGHTPTEHHGWGWLDFVHPQDRESCRRALAESVARRAPAQWDYRVRDASGEYRWVLDRNAPVETADGGFVGFVGSSTDITQRRQAEESVRLVAEAGVELGGSLDYEEILKRLAEFAVRGFADSCVIQAGAEGARVPRMTVIRSNRGVQGVQAWPREVLQAACANVAEHLARTGQPSVAIEAAEGARPTPGGAWDIGPLRDLGVQSAIAVSLTAQDRILGAILFLRGTSRPCFQPEDRTLAEDLGRRTSAAIENARLYSHLADRESDLERINEVLTFLLDASAELASTLDPNEMLKRLATLATPRIADWCAIATLDTNGTAHTLTVSHADPAMIELGDKIQARYPFGSRPDSPVMRALRGGKGQFFPVVHDEMIRATAADDEHYRLIQQLGLRSLIVVPLASGATVYAAMMFVMSNSGRSYGEPDFATLQDLGRRAGVALENAHLYAEGQRREAELLRANEAQDEFLGMMSHELRTPLTIINGGARVLRSRASDLDNETKDAILSDIEGESERLFRMVENLLSLSHLQFGESFEVEPVHVGRLTEKVITSFLSRRPNRPVTLEVEPGAETFAAQPVYLEQVIRNLLSNADKYSPSGAPIEIRVARTGEGVGELHVLDRGVGIDPEEANLIFERFYRSERTSRLVGGSGVGLALCKRLIEAMSGQVWARPREGGGLEVGFSLPLYEEAFV